MAEFCFLEPLDSLSFHDHRLFGAFGGSFPPAPSVVAGALRSRLLADTGCELDELAGFCLTWFSLGRASDSGCEPLLPFPDDLVRSQGTCYWLSPGECRPGCDSSHPLPALARLRSSRRAKPEPGGWLPQAQFQEYLAGRTPTHWLETKDLLGHEVRTGLALDAGRRTAAEGLLYSLQATVLKPQVGFLAGVEGARLPQGGLVRLGGEGRAASLRPCPGVTWERDWGAIGRERRFRLLLTTPAVFADGWRPPELAFGGGRARLVSARVARHGLAAGWDLAQARPKASSRTVPPGSVYWFDQLEGGTQWLQELECLGWWALIPGAESDPRRAEGFNRFVIAAWPAEQGR